MLAIPSRVIATCFALIGFAAATIVGAFVGNDATTILVRATAIMLPCWIVGYIIGRFAQQTVDENLHQYFEDNPIPDEQTYRDHAEASAGATEPAVSTP